MGKQIIVPPVLKDPKNKPEFPLDIANQTGMDSMKFKIDPLAPKHIADFDWEVLRRMMKEAQDEMSNTDYELLAQVMRLLLSWIVKGIDAEIIGRRAVALAWVINPDIFDGGPSATKLARLIGCNNREMFSYSTREASRQFGIRNRAQNHGWNFKAGADDADGGKLGHKANGAKRGAAKGRGASPQ